MALDRNKKGRRLLRMGSSANHGIGSVTCHISISVPLFCVTGQLLGREPILFSNAKWTYV
jgi:hypothetical protein